MQHSAAFIGCMQHRWGAIFPFRELTPSGADLALPWSSNLEAYGRQALAIGSDRQGALIGFAWCYPAFSDVWLSEENS